MKKPTDIRDAHGGIAVVTALSLTVLTGVAGLATIYVQAQAAKTSIQASLDAAVLAGTALDNHATEAERIGAAQQAFEFNLQAATKGSSVEIEITSATEFLIDEARVTGKAHGKVKNSLGAALGITSMAVEASAAAKRGQSDPLCILALDDSEPSTIEAYGDAQINARDCAVQANSSNGEGMKIYGSATATASQFGVSGSYAGHAWSPDPVTGVEPVVDPYASLPVPEAGACVDVGGKLSGSHYTLDPGTYCGGLSIGAKAKVTLNPGIYIMKDGQFSAGSGAKISGEEVMIAFIGADSYLHLLSGSETALTSPMSGTYKNIQFMSDRDLSQSKFEQEWTTILSGATLKYDGVMYLPEQQLWVSGTGHDIIIEANSPSLAIVVNKLWAQGNVVLEVTQEDRRGIGEVTRAPGFGYGAMLAD